LRVKDLNVNFNAERREMETGFLIADRRSPKLMTEN
jgi:hypothetical protein